MVRQVVGAVAAGGKEPVTGDRRHRPRPPGLDEVEDFDRALAGHSKHAPAKTHARRLAAVKIGDAHQFQRPFIIGQARDGDLRLTVAGRISMAERGPHTVGPVQSPVGNQPGARPRHGRIRRMTHAVGRHGVQRIAPRAVDSHHHVAVYRHVVRAAHLAAFLRPADRAEAQRGGRPVARRDGGETAGLARGNDRARLAETSHAVDQIEQFAVAGGVQQREPAVRRDAHAMRVPRADQPRAVSQRQHGFRLLEQCRVVEKVQHLRRGRFAHVDGRQRAAFARHERHVAAHLDIMRPAQGVGCDEHAGFVKAGHGV